jgi:hypothetical protein
MLMMIIRLILPQLLQHSLCRHLGEEKKIEGATSCRNSSSAAH